MSTQPRASSAQPASISPTLRVNEMAKALLEAGKPVIHMGFGESQCPPPKGLVEALKEQAHRAEYEKVQGLAALRQAVADRYEKDYRLNVKPEQVIITPGSKALLYAAIRQIEGDVVLPRPSWVTYQPQALYSGKRVFWIDTQVEENFMPTAEALRQTVASAKEQGGKPGILVLNSPNNPTGSALSPAQSKALAQTCRELGLYVLSDELYRRVMHAGYAFHSIGTDYPEGTILIGGLSKDVAVGGWRLGWGILPDTEAGRTLCRSINAFGSEIWSSAPTPVQYAALYGLSDAPDTLAYLDSMARFHGQRTRVLYEGLTRIGLSMPEPMGGFYLYPNFSAFQKPLATLGIQTSEQLQDYLLQHLHIVGLAGSAFGDAPDNLCLRFSTSHLDLMSGQSAEALLASWEDGGHARDFVSAQTHPQLFEVIERLEGFLRELSAG